VILWAALCACRRLFWLALQPLFEDKAQANVSVFVGGLAATYNRENLEPKFFLIEIGGNVHKSRCS
jgi:hypothetical protein